MLLQPTSSKRRGRPISHLRFARSEYELAWQVAICGRPIRELHYISIGRRVQRITADYFGITVEQLLSRSRRDQFLIPRQIALKVTADIFQKLNKSKLSQLFKLDHGTIINALDVICSKARNDPDIAKAMLDVRWMVQFELERPL